MNSKVLVALALSGCSAGTAVKPVPTPRPSYAYEGAETFGSRRLSQNVLMNRLGLPPPGSAIDDGLPSGLDKARNELLAEGVIAFCKFSFVTDERAKTLRITVDLVDKGDEWRMKFVPAPTGDARDPGGLIAAWNDYQRTFWQLVQRGEVAYTPGQESHCRAFGCFGGFDHPKLAPFEERFVRDVPANVDGLVRVLHEDGNVDKRMNSIKLLGYTPDREQLIAELLPFVRDEQEGVRNEALRMLGDVQHQALKLVLPLDTVLDAMWMPLETDRNKATWALVRILEAEGRLHARRIAEKSGEVLVSMVGMRQDTDATPARLVLEVISGEKHGNDRKAWRRWLERIRGKPVQLLAGN